MNPGEKLRSDISVHAIGCTIVILLLFGITAAYIGILCIENAVRHQIYVDSYPMANTASIFVNGDHIDSYLAGEEKEEYDTTKQVLNDLCHSMDVSLIYVIKPDTDYKSFVSVFNAVNNNADDTDLVPWELGYHRETTNDTYQEKYRAICESDSVGEIVFRGEDEEYQNPHITTLVPIKNSGGNVTAILCTERSVKRFMDVISPFLLFCIFGIAVMLIVVSALIGVYMQGFIISPIKRITSESVRFADEHTRVNPPMGDISRYEIFNDLSHSIDSMEEDMVKYIKDITEATARDQKFKADLELASQIQNYSLPKVTPEFTLHSNFDLYAFMNPALGVCGDFYDFFFTDEDHLILLLGDVAGKGIPAAITMMAVKNTLHTNAVALESPAAILKSTNISFCARNGTAMFVTVWLGVLELSTGKMIAANAGHEYPAIKSPNGPFEILKDKHNLVIGAFDTTDYDEYELQLEPGSKLFIYSDGVPDSTNADQTRFDIDRMLDSLNKHKDDSPKEIIEGMCEDVNAFVGDVQQFDDLTMLCIQIKDRKTVIQDAEITPVKDSGKENTSA